MKVLKGAEVASAICEQIQNAMRGIDKTPRLCTVRVGEKPDDISYERSARRRMEKLGIECESIVFPNDITHDELRNEIIKINADDSVDGILMFRPLPKHIDEDKICALISPEKDVDCINPASLAKVFMCENDCFAPCTAAAVIEMLDHEKIDLTGKNVAIIGRSLVVGRPLSMLMLKRNATVTICHTKTKDTSTITQKADIVVACAGRSGLVTGDYLGDGAIIIDVGINCDADGKLTGDVDFESASKKASLITPVPGGVGGVTTAVLAKHTVMAAAKKCRK